MIRRHVLGNLASIYLVAAALSPWNAHALAVSRGEQFLPIDFRECVARAFRAFVAEGYRSDPSQGASFVAGFKGNSGGYITCNEIGGGRTLVNVFIASEGTGDSGVPGAERVRLQQRMDQSAPPVGSGGGIRVLSGTYGGNCGVKAGNVTEPLAGACNGKPSCDYRVDYRVIGDPAGGCAKTYVAEWLCGSDPNPRRAESAAEAGYGSVVALRCDGFAPPPPPPVGGTPGGIRLVAGTYGANCGVARGNVTSQIAAACNGKSSCNYRVDYQVIGDPAGGCAKTYTAEWQCGNDPRILRADAPAEAGYGSIVPLRCGGN